MLSLFIWDLPLLEDCSIIFRYLTHIGKEYIKTFDLCEDSGSYTAFASA